MELKIQGPPLVILNGYGPHSGRAIEEREEFYEQIKKRYTKIGRGKEILAIGDWNVRFHGRRESEEETIGPWTVGRGNEFMEKCERKVSQASNRELCMDWCEEFDLVRQNSQFQKPIAKKVTYREIGTEQTDRNWSWENTRN